MHLLVTGSMKQHQVFLAILTAPDDRVQMMSMNLLAIDQRVSTDRTLPLLTLSQTVIFGAFAPVQFALPQLTLIPVVEQLRIIR